MTYSANVLLVNPPSGIIYSSPPLRLAYIASSLMSRGHEVKVLDLNLYKTPEKRLRKYLQSFSPDVVGVTVTTPTTSSAKRVLEITKELGIKILGYFILGAPGEGIDEIKKHNQICKTTKHRLCPVFHFNSLSRLRDFLITKER